MELTKIAKAHTLLFMAYLQLAKARHFYGSAASANTIGKEAGYIMQKKKNPFIEVRKYWMVYLMILPAFVLTLIFQYIPIGGLATAFKDFNVFRGFWASPWAGQFGFANILSILSNKPLLESISNTVLLSVLNIAISFPAPIILALMINELRAGPFKKSVQTISYLPHFLSWITVIGLIKVLFSLYGPVNDIAVALAGEGRERTLFLTNQGFHLPMLLLGNLWKTVGFNSIIFISALSGIDPQLYEAAKIDGASRWRQTLHVTIPGISITIVLLLILNIGTIMNSNFEFVFGMQNPFITFETVDTIIYKYGLMGRNYSVGTALGLVRGLIALLLTLGANWMSKKINQISLI